MIGLRCCFPHSKPDRGTRQKTDNLRPVRGEKKKKPPDFKIPLRFSSGHSPTREAESLLEKGDPAVIYYPAARYYSTYRPHRRSHRQLGLIISVMLQLSCPIRWPVIYHVPCCWRRLMLTLFLGVELIVRTWESHRIIRFLVRNRIRFSTAVVEQRPCPSMFRLLSSSSTPCWPNV